MTVGLHVMVGRVVSAATRQAWIARERALVLGARLAPAATALCTPVDNAVAVRTETVLRRGEENAPAQGAGEHVMVREGPDNMSGAALHVPQAQHSHVRNAPESPPMTRPEALATNGAGDASVPSWSGADEGAQGPRQKSARTKRLVSLIVKDVLGGRQDIALQVAPNLTLAELKGKLCMAYQDSPAPARQLLVCQGRHLRDDETIGALLGQTQGTRCTSVGVAATPTSEERLEFFVTIHPRVFGMV